MRGQPGWITVWGFLKSERSQRVFWGDTHLHTSYSTDAGMVGNRLGPDEALRFATGEKVISSTGLPARLIRPLDFLVVADHAENLGLAPMIEASDPALLRDPMGKKYHDLVKSGKGWDAFQLRKTPVSTSFKYMRDVALDIAGLEVTGGVDADAYYKLPTLLWVSDRKQRKLESNGGIQPSLHVGAWWR